MSDAQVVPEEDRPVLPEDEDKVARTEVPASDAQIPADDLPETQEDDPLLAELGENGQGDVAPEDEPNANAGDAPHDLRDSTS
jgi:hypothetical protein